MLAVLAELPAIGRSRHHPPGPLDVHLWSHEHHAKIASDRMAALLAQLSPDEHTRLARLRDDRRRQRFIVGRALCRQALSHYAPVSPEAWRFALGDHDKPFVAAPTLGSPLWFSLTHTDGISICAVTGAGPEIGVDIEPIARGTDALEIAAHFFPEIERNALKLVPAAERAEAFVHHWALKESFVKARGTSLADGISGAAFDISPAGNINVTFLEPLHERAQEWNFELVRFDPARIVALAVKGNGPLNLRAETCW